MDTARRLSLSGPGRPPIPNSSPQSQILEPGIWAAGLGADLLLKDCKWMEAHMGTLITTVILSLSGLALAVTAFSSFRGVRAYLRTRGKRLVTCPQNHCTAAVEMDALGAGLKAFRGGTYRCLQDCSRWPEKSECAQDCLTQIDVLGAGCLVRNVVAGWYKGKACVYCHKPVDNVAEWTGHMPALLTPASTTVSWADVPPDKLPEIFTTYQPVCWSCHIAETFRRDHPELVTDRPPRW